MTDEEYLKLNIREIDWLSMPDEEIDRVLQLRVDNYERAIAERGGKRPIETTGHSRRCSLTFPSFQRLTMTS